MHVADHDAEADARIGEQLVQAVLLRGEQANELLPLPGHQA